MKIVSLYYFFIKWTLGMTLIMDTVLEVNRHFSIYYVKQWANVLRDQLCNSQQYRLWKKKKNRIMQN